MWIIINIKKQKKIAKWVAVKVQTKHPVQEKKPTRSSLRQTPVPEVLISSTTHAMILQRDFTSAYHMFQQPEKIFYMQLDSTTNPKQV